MGFFKKIIKKVTKPIKKFANSMEKRGIHTSVSTGSSGTQIVIHK